MTVLIIMKGYDWLIVVDRVVKIFTQLCSFTHGMCLAPDLPNIPRWPVAKIFGQFHNQSAQRMQIFRMIPCTSLIGEVALFGNFPIPWAHWSIGPISYQ